MGGESCADAPPLLAGFGVFLYACLKGETVGSDDMIQVKEFLDES